MKRGFRELREGYMLSNTIQFQKLLEEKKLDAIAFAERCQFNIDNSEVIYSRASSHVIFVMWARWSFQHSSFHTYEMFDILLATNAGCEPGFDIFEAIIDAQPQCAFLTSAVIR